MVRNIESILEEVKRNCFLNQGRPFELNIGEFYWSKKYHGDKLLFMCSWRYVCTEYYEKCNEQKRILKKLPSGITYSENATLIQQLPAKPEQYHTVHERYKSVLSIHVSEAYSRKVFNTHAKDRIIILSDTTNKTLKLALDFKNKIYASHNDILAPLFTEMQRFGTLTNYGFTDYDHGFQFERIKMKPLTHDYQRLGLALALTEYGLFHLAEDEMYFITDKPEAETTHISKAKIKQALSSLRNW